MSESIKVGDTVMVVRARVCCAKPTGAEGGAFVVSRLWADSNSQRCLCGADYSGILLANGFPGRDGIDLRRLIKIPPLSESDTTAREKEEQT